MVPVTHPSIPVPGFSASSSSGTELLAAPAAPCVGLCARGSTVFLASGSPPKVKLVAGVRAN